MLNRWGHDFTSNREGEIYKPLGQLGRIQMSKGKPIEWSTTLFFFYSQSSKFHEGSYCLGMGNVWRSNSNLGSHPFLESVFLTCGASKCLGMHAQAIIHPCLSFHHPFTFTSRLSQAWEAWRALPHPSS